MLLAASPRLMLEMPKLNIPAFAPETAIVPALNNNEPPAKLALFPVMSPVALIKPPVFRLPTLALPVTLRLSRVPTEVMLGCAFVYTVPASNAFAT